MDNSKKTITVGGQAVLEGVMMRSPHSVSTAVRRSNGEIVVKTEPFQSLLLRHKFLNIPILRGSIAIIEMMIIGTTALQYSADIAMQDEKGTTEHKPQAQWHLIATTIIALGVGLAIFFAGPILIVTTLLGLEQQAWQFNLASGIIRTVMFLAYLLIISQMKDIFRLFQYHGAEHVSIYTFENKEALIPVNGTKYDTPHPRCGTSFLMFVMLASVVSFAIIDSIYIAWVGPLNLTSRLLLHIPFIPVVAGLSYELIRLSGKYYHIAIARVFMKPGLWLQRITTKKPDETQIEVAMVALKAALGADLIREYEAGQIAGTMSVHE